jgi:hypothetical protein
MLLIYYKAVTSKEANRPLLYLLVFATYYLLSAFIYANSQTFCLYDQQGLEAFGRLPLLYLSYY